MTFSDELYSCSYLPGLCDLSVSVEEIHLPNISGVCEEFYVVLLMVFKPVLFPLLS
jgi:hypothetical protein